MLTWTLNTSAAPTRRDSQAIRIFEILNDLKYQLGIPDNVQVRIVSHNPLLFSVHRDYAHSEFVVSISSRFVSELDEQDLAAALAHELGHVWIYTHHPFLHTEVLANEIAVRVVSQESLMKLYRKLSRFETIRDAN